MVTMTPWTSSCLEPSGGWGNWANSSAVSSLPVTVDMRRSLLLARWYPRATKRGNATRPSGEQAMADMPAEKPFRVGIFRTTAEASSAIDALLAAGFKKEELAVVCADQSVEKFRDIPHPSPGAPAHPSKPSGVAR